MQLARDLYLVACFISYLTVRLVVQVVHPVCPMMKGASGLAVQSYWCPLTGTCEEFCYSSLQMQPDQ